eukprot:jgi/Picsp_1/4565/NSC_01935-R1_dna mismatch repair protein msh6
MGLTEEQRRRAETNRLAALGRRRQLLERAAALHADAVAPGRESGMPLGTTGSWYQFTDSPGNGNGDFRSGGFVANGESHGCFNQNMLHRQHAGTGIGKAFGSDWVPCAQSNPIDRMSLEIGKDTYMVDASVEESILGDACSGPGIMTTGLVGNVSLMEDARPMQQRQDEEHKSGRRDSGQMDKSPVQPRQLIQATLRQTMQRYRKKSSMRKSAKEQHRAVSKGRGSDISFADALKGIEEESRKSEALVDFKGFSMRPSKGNGQETGSVAVAAAVAAASSSERRAGQHAASGPPGLRKDIKKELCKRLDSQSSKYKAGRWQWLKEKRDGNGNIPSDPNFDPRTLLIPEFEFEALKGFNKQYWSIKKENMDLVLFVRVGAFYELYDIDADVGLRVGLNPMGEKTGSLQANMWRVGFHASSFDIWCHKVLMLGYSVGRVEEVISGSSECCASTGRNALRLRRLEQVYTPGTFSLMAWSGEEHYAINRPWMALCEGENGLLACCLVDVVRGSFQVKEWQEVDSNRSILEHLMLHSNLIEVVLPYWGHVSIDTKKRLKRFRPIVSDGIDRKLNVSLLRLGAMGKGKRIPVTEKEARQQILQSVNESGAKSIHKFVSEDKGIGYLSLLSLWTALTHLKSTSSGAGVLRVASVLPSLNTDSALVTGRLFMDTASLKSLDIIHGPLGTEKGSLYQVLSSKIATKKGKHCLYDWLLNPLYREADIYERLDAIGSIQRRIKNAKDFQKALLMLPDMEKTLPFIANRFAKLLQKNSCMDGTISDDGFEQRDACLRIGDFRNFGILIDCLFRLVDIWERCCAIRALDSDLCDALQVC